MDTIFGLSENSRQGFEGLQATMYLESLASNSNTASGLELDLRWDCTGSHSSARWYDPQARRFISEDPIGLNGGINLYAYVGNNPINRIDPFGLEDKATPWQVGWEWLTGKGPRVHYFTDGDPFTEQLKQHSHIQNLVKNVCSGELRQYGNDNYSLSGIQGVPKYFKDYSTLLTGGLTGNLAATYLGSYTLRYEVIDGVLNIHVENNSTMSSATHPPIIGYTNWWDNNIGKPLDNTFSSGPMSPTKQVFDFKINLSK